MLSRRSLLTLLTGSAAMAAAAWRHGLSLRSENACPVFFHLDRLHLDPNRLSAPYCAPNGFRSLDHLAGMSEAQVRRLNPYL